MKPVITFLLTLSVSAQCWAGSHAVQISRGSTGSPLTTPVISATPGDTTNTITLVSGDVGALTNVLYWDTTSRATYDLYANSIDNATLVAASFPGTPYVHTGRTNGVPYYYMLRGTDVAGSTSSAEVSGTPAAAGGNGFVGTQAAVADATDYGGKRSSWWGVFTASATGTVSYIYVRRYDSGLDENLICPAIWSADGATVLANSANCTATTISTHTFRYALATPITVTSGTQYRLGFGTGDSGWATGYAGVAGTYYGSDDYYTPSACPDGEIETTPTAIYTYTDGALPIWASNSASDT